MFIFYYLLFGLLILFIIGVFFLIKTAPKEIMFSREVEIDASIELVFDFVSDLHKMKSWNPWLNLDSKIQEKFSGEIYGVGASYEWSGNSKVGVGSITTTEVEHPTKTVQSLKFGYNVSVSTFSLEKISESKTHIKWRFLAIQNDHISFKIMSHFIEKIIGKDFDKGLNNLKKLLEKR